MQVVPLQHTRLRCVLPVLTLAAAYAVAARLGLWFAIPPGYATAIWPASGLALAGVLMGGAWVWPGIWLGSFVVNLWTAWDTSHAATLLTSVAIPTSIGVGATAQALVGAALVRRWVGFPSPLTRARDICHLSAAGRTAQLPGECHCWRHDSGGQRPDPVVAVRHDVVDMVGGGHARRPHRHAAGAELAR